MIKFDNIQIKYGDFVAIDNLNLDIHEGEFFTFLGPSGCGKSTTLRALVGFLDPSSGSIEVNGTDVTHLEPEKAWNWYCISILCAISNYDCF